MGIYTQQDTLVAGLGLTGSNHLTREHTVDNTAGNLGKLSAVGIDIAVNLHTMYGERHLSEQALLVIEGHRSVAIEAAVEIALVIKHLGLDIKLHQRADLGDRITVGHIGVIHLGDVETRDGIVHLDGGVAEQEERELVGLGGLKAQFTLLVGLAQGGHVPLGGVAEQGLDEEGVHVVIVAGKYQSRRGEQGDSATIALMVHDLGDTTAVAIKAGNVAARSRQDGQVVNAGIDNVGGHPHVAILGQTDGTSVAHIGTKVQTVLERVGQLLLGDSGILALKLHIGLGGGTRIHGVVNGAHMHTSQQFIVNQVLVAFALKHVLALVGRIREHQGVIAPNAIIGISIILYQLIDVILGLGKIFGSHAADTNRQSLGRDVGT